MYNFARGAFADNKVNSALFLGRLSKLPCCRIFMEKLQLSSTFSNVEINYRNVVTICWCRDGINFSADFALEMKSDRTQSDYGK